VHAHDRARLRLVTGHALQALRDQLLDQMGARGLVLDQHNRGPKPLVSGVRPRITLYLIDLLRRRTEYPQLKRELRALFKVRERLAIVAAIQHRSREKAVTDQ
jgi:hypothetical protein